MQNNKLILGVMAFQSLIILFLAYMMFSLEARTGDLAYEIAAARLGSNSNTSASAPQAAAAINPLTSPTAFETRQIVREEIDALADKLLAEMGDGRPIAAPSPPATPDEIRQLQDTASAQINAMIQGSTNSQISITNFEDTIARLPPKERKAALSQLSKAINRGDIDIRF